MNSKKGRQRSLPTSKISSSSSSSGEVMPFVTRIIPPKEVQLLQQPEQPKQPDPINLVYVFFKKWDSSGV